jgi:protein O-mannosyl-transferase
MNLRLNIFNLKPIFRKIIIPFIIILLTIFAYCDVRNHQFINFDDNAHITENSYIQSGLNFETLRWAFSYTGIDYWQPLTWLSHIMDYWLFGLSPSGYHQVSLAIHILNSIFLFFIILGMTGAQYKAAVIALLFAVHPLNVESVAWVSERKTVLSTLFFMAALYAYIRYTRSNKIRLYFLVIFLFALGLMSKPGIIIFPFLLLILDYWPLARFEKESVANNIGKNILNLFERFLAGFHLSVHSNGYFLILEKVPLFTLSLISYYISMASISKYNIVTNFDQIALDLRIYNLFVSTMKYLMNMVLPLKLSIFYPFPKSIPATHILYSILAMVLITIATIIYRKSRPWIITGWLWFLVALAPASGLIQAGLWPEMADRFMYLPMIGLFILVIWECDARMEGRYSGVLKMVLCCAVMVYFIALTKIQNLYFSNSYSLFTRAIEVTQENFIAYNNVGTALDSLNRGNEAIEYFQEAIKINPKCVIAMNNYAYCLSKRGDYINAYSLYKRAIAIQPNWPGLLINLASNLHLMGIPDESKKYLEKALELEPDNDKAHSLLGTILLEQGKTEEAIRHFSIVVEKKSNWIQARLNLAQAYEKNGRFEEAMNQLEAIIQKKHADKGEAYYGMAGIKSQQNQFEKCKIYLELSLKHGFNVFEQMTSDDRFTKFRDTDQYTQLLGNQTFQCK